MAESKALQLTRLITEKNGNISAKDIEWLDLPFDVFLRLAQIDNNILVKRANLAIKKLSNN